MAEKRELLATVTGPAKAILKEAGFKRAGKLFFKRVDDVWLLVEFQLSRDAVGPDALKFAVNLGAYSIRVGRTGGPDLEESQHPAFPMVHVRNRLGAGASDRWWLVQSEAEAEAAASEVGTLLRGEGLAWLESMDANDKIRRVYEQSDPMRFRRQIAALSPNPDRTGQ
jgi:Domain of unknown function (DUF4304)